MIVPLETVIVEDRARDGTWCTLPYLGHPRGCPNYPKCIESRPPFNEFEGFDWFAVVIKFDLKDHAERMKKKHPKWSERQCRNLLYWQPAVMKALRIRAEQFAFPIFGDVILDLPEANGVQVFDTMAKHGLILERHKPDTIHKVMLVGKPNINFNNVKGG